VFKRVDIEGIDDGSTGCDEIFKNKVEQQKC